MMKKIFLACAVSLISFVIATTAQANAFIALADIHFDPFRGCHTKPCQLITSLQAVPVTSWASILEQYDKSSTHYFVDTNYQLLNSTLQETNILVQQHQAQFVMMFGDELGHNYRNHYIRYTGDHSRAGYEAFTRKTLQFLTYSFTKALPQTTIYSVLGNNDTYHKDYVTRPQSVFLKDASNVFSSRVHDAALQQSIRKQMPAYGYYAINISSAPPLMLIALNTNLFSNKVKTQRQTDAAAAQLRWLHQMLEQATANHASVYLAMHIPANIDIYASFDVKLITVATLWQSAVAKQFEQEIEQHADIIRGIFSGHLHTDWLHIKRYGKDYTIPLIGVPSVSPFFGNTPAIKVIFYTPDYQIKNYLVYDYHFTRNKEWKLEYNFNELYHRDCVVCSAKSLLSPLTTDSTA